MKIDWTTSYRNDGSPRAPPPNSLHGWLAKMRGTLAGDEDLRSKGMREMRDARRYKESQRARAKLAAGSGSLLSMFRKSKEAPQQPRTPGRRLTREDRSMSYSSQKSRKSTTGSSSKPRSQPPPPTRRSTGMSSRSMPGGYPGHPVDSPTRASRPTPSRKTSRR